MTLGSIVCRRIQWKKCWSWFPLVEFVLESISLGRFKVECFETPEVNVAQASRVGYDMVDEEVNEAKGRIEDVYNDKT